MKLYENGAYLLNGKEVIIDGPDAQAAVKSKTGMDIDKQTAKQETIAYGILKEHNTSGNMDKLQIKFDKLTSHDITFVGIIRQHELQDLRNSLSRMYLQTVTTAFVQLVEQSMRMTTCLVSHVQRSTAESMYHLIRQLSISLHERCLPAAEK